MAGGWREVAVLGRIWLVTDCCGLVCAFITWLLGLLKNPYSTTTCLFSGVCRICVFGSVPSTWRFHIVIMYRYSNIQWVRRFGDS